MKDDTRYKIGQAVFLFLFSLVGVAVPVFFKATQRQAGRSLFRRALAKKSSENPDEHSRLHASYQTVNWEIIREDLRRNSSSYTQDEGSETEWIAVLLSCGNAFSGGVMLATGIAHILADAIEMSLASDPRNPVKLAILSPLALCLIGILIPFTLEKSGLVWWLLSSQQLCTSHYVDMHEDHGTVKMHESFSFPEIPSNQFETDLSMKRTASLDQQTFNLGDQNNAKRCTSKCVVPGFNSTRIQSRLDMYRSTGSTRALKNAPLVYTEHGEHHEEIRGFHAELLQSESMTSKSSTRNAKEACHHPEKHSHMNFATFLMFVVLSVHSIIVGLSIGSMQVMQASFGEPAFLAFALHKIFESVALGTIATRDSLSNSVLIELTSYIIAAPLGILVGSEMTTIGILSKSSQAKMLGIASGSFIFIALVEILGEEFENEEYRVVKFICFCVGALFMTLLAY